MRNYLKFINITLLLLAIYSCNKEEDLQYLSDCIEVNEPTDWIKEQYNLNYTIMYPEIYKSTSKYLLPWNKFEIRREDEKVVIEGGFCHPAALPCHVLEYLGESIDPEKDSIPLNDTNEKYLNFKKTFCQDNIDIAHFYYNDTMGGNFRNAYGLLYLIDKSDSTFRLAGSISFAESEKYEIFDILGTLYCEL